MITHKNNNTLKTNHRRITDWYDTKFDDTLDSWFDYFRLHLNKPCAIVKVGDSYALFTLGGIDSIGLKGINTDWEVEILEKTDEIVKYHNTDVIFAVEAGRV